MDFAFNLILPAPAVPYVFGFPVVASMIQMCLKIHQLERSFPDLPTLRSNLLGTGKHQVPVLLNGVVRMWCIEKQMQNLTDLLPCFLSPRFSVLLISTKSDKG